MFKIATWNVNSINVRLPHILQWLESEKADVLAIQETKCIDEKFPVDEINEAGYQVVFSGQKTYNGMAVLSLSKGDDVVTDVPDLDDPQRRILGITINSVRILNLYIPNGAGLDSDKYPYKLDWLAKVTNYIKQQLEEHSQMIILGDFNIAPEDRDVHHPKEWEGGVLVSEPERAAFTKMLELGLQDTFRLFEQEEKTYSWWDYRAAAFRRNHGLKIDHILASSDLAKRCQSSTIDKTPRKWERPSDHTPVIAEFLLDK